ncbi:MAG: hypothetical protein U0176_08430 [Bacteroidia bacterium]
MEKRASPTSTTSKAPRPPRPTGYRAWSIISPPGNNGYNNMVSRRPDGMLRSAKASTAKLAWYSIDPSFYYGITDEVFAESELSNHYIRQVTPQRGLPKPDPYHGRQRASDI